jgi:hypothetical protein
MTARYLLPCRCGQQIVVEPRQAGETVACTCGATLSIPTLLDIKNLDPAPQADPAKTSRTMWSAKHQLRLLGMALLAAAMIGGVWLHMTRPTSRFDAVDPERIRENYKTFSPVVTWEAWTYMQKGLDRRIDVQYATAMSMYRAWQAVVGVLAIVGVAMLIGGMVRGKKTGLHVLLNGR